MKLDSGISGSAVYISLLEGYCFYENLINHSRTSPIYLYSSCIY